MATTEMNRHRRDDPNARGSLKRFAHSLPLPMAWGAQVALMRQRTEGGSWRVQVSLARTAQWLRELGRVVPGFIAAKHDFAGLLETSSSGWGELAAIQHAARLSHTPARCGRASVPPGTDPLRW